MSKRSLSRKEHERFEKRYGKAQEARRPRIETVTYSMPVYWASYLINGDASSLDDDEIAQADAAIEDIGFGAPVDVGDSEFRHRGDYGRLAGDYADYTFHKIEGASEARAPRVVRDFNTLDDLIAHAASDLGATHVSGSGPETKIYFPRGGQHPYEAASVRRKGGYWHADGPGAREGVTKLPAGAKPIGGHAGRRAAEAHDSLRKLTLGKPERHRSGFGPKQHTVERTPVYDSSGREVGAIQRRFTKNRAIDTMTVHHATHSSVRGSDLAWLERQEAAYSSGYPSNISPTSSEARRGSSGAEAAGEQAATTSLNSEHFTVWVRDQLAEAAEAEKRDPDSVMPLETKSDAKQIARNMLQNLEWDMKHQGAAEEALGREASREDIKEFYSGVHKTLQDAVPWLAEELLTLHGEMHEAPKAKRSASPRSPTSKGKSSKRARTSSARPRVSSRKISKSKPAKSRKRRKA